MCPFAETLNDHLLRGLASEGLASYQEACQGFLRQVIPVGGNGRRDDLFEFVIAFTVCRYEDLLRAISSDVRQTIRCDLPCQRVVPCQRR